MLRLAKISDLPQLLALEQNFTSERISRASFRRFLREKKNIFVAIENKKIVGYILWLARRDTSKIRIYSLVVDPDFRGRGFAQKLIRKVLAQFPDRVFALEVEKINFSALQLYKKFGFHEVKKLPGYYGYKKDGLRMQRD